MLGLKWLARRQHRRVTNMKLQLQKDFDRTMTAREEGFKKNLARIQEKCDEDRQRDKEEALKTIAELQKKIDEKIQENIELQEKHKEIQKKTLRRFESQEQDRINEVLILKDELEELRNNGRSYKIFWEEMIEYLKHKGHEMINQQESDRILQDEIIKRVAILEERSDNKNKNLEDIRKHMLKTLKKAPELSDKVINVASSSFELKPEDTP